MTNELNHVDICFVIDTTGSMGSFIRAAQRELLNALELLSQKSHIDLQVGLVEYRDHPPQDNSFVTKVYPLTNNLKEIQKKINGLSAGGGGDAPEAVYSGIYDACNQMQWRSHSYRFIMLVGDAPPHGFAKWVYEFTGHKVSNHGDHWPNGCPSGLDVQAVTSAAEEKRVKIYGLCMNNDSATQEAFKIIASFTGGESTSATSGNQIINQILDLLVAEFNNLAFDRQVLETVEQLQQLDTTVIAEALDSPRLPVAQAISRLGKRELLENLTYSI